MQQVVKVTRRGQTTIPRDFREKYGIREGDRILVEDRDGELVIRVIPKLEALAGIYAKYGRKEELKKKLEKLREEYH